MNELGDKLGEQALAGDERWELVCRIADTAPFRRSLRLRTFLQYVCEQTLLGRSENLHESEIGRVVFGKPLDYNPGDDNIVRVTARLLRKRLNEYFEGPGKDEPLRVMIPTGRYVPVFENHTADAVAAPVPDEPESPALPPEPVPRPRRLVPLLIGLCALLAIACTVLAFQNARLRESAAPVLVPLNPVLASVFEQDRPTKIIVSDSTYSLAQDLTQSRQTLYQYIDAFPRSLLETPRPAGFNELIRQTLRRSYTSLADLNTAVRLIQVSAPYWRNTRVFFARNVVARDLKGANLILIGSRRSNPWVEMFEGSLNFRYERDGVTGEAVFQNRAPRDGEPPLYRNDAGQYAQVALAPNLDNDGRVLILAGATNTGTEAAGEFVTSARHVDALLKTLQVAGSDARLDGFDALLRLNSIAGMPRESSIAACRRGRPPGKAGLRSSPGPP